MDRQLEIAQEFNRAVHHKLGVPYHAGGDGVLAAIDVLREARSEALDKANTYAAGLRAERDLARRDAVANLERAEAADAQRNALQSDVAAIRAGLGLGYASTRDQILERCARLMDEDRQFDALASKLSAADAALSRVMQERTAAEATRHMVSKALWPAFEVTSSEPTDSEILGRIQVLNAARDRFEKAEADRDQRMLDTIAINTALGLPPTDALKRAVARIAELTKAQPPAQLTPERVAISEADVKRIWDDITAARGFLTSLDQIKSGNYGSLVIFARRVAVNACRSDAPAPRIQEPAPFGSLFTSQRVEQLYTYVRDFPDYCNAVTQWSALGMPERRFTRALLNHALDQEEARRAPPVLHGQIDEDGTVRVYLDGKLAWERASEKAPTPPLPPLMVPAFCVEHWREGKRYAGHDETERDVRTTVAWLHDCIAVLDAARRGAGGSAK